MLHEFALVNALESQVIFHCFVPVFLVQFFEFLNILLLALADSLSLLRIEPGEEFIDLGLASHILDFRIFALVVLMARLCEVLLVFSIFSIVILDASGLTPSPTLGRIRHSSLAGVSD